MQWALALGQPWGFLFHAIQGTCYSRGLQYLQYIPDMLQYTFVKFVGVVLVGC
jgi:hypothetical protein